MITLRVEGLPDLPSAAAATFHSEWLPRAKTLLDPPPEGEDLVLVFPPADHTHRGWRLAAMQALAREHAPARVNGLAGGSAASIAAGRAYLEAAEGVTGQYLPLDDAGAGPVIQPPE